MKKTLNFLQNGPGAALSCGVLAFAGGLLSVPFNGFTAALPLLTICALVAGLLKINAFAECLIFAVCSGALATIYGNTEHDTVAFAVTAFAIAAMCRIAVNLIKKKKTVWCAIPLGAAVAIQLAMGGNIISYLKDKAVIEDYVNSNYSQSDVKISSVTYHWLTRTYRANITHGKSADINGDLVCSDGVIFDNYVNLSETHEMSELRAKINDVLRKSFVEGSFTVTGLNVSGFTPDTVNTEEDFASRCTFAVYLGRLNDREGFLEQVKSYRHILQESGGEYGKIIFRGGGLNSYYFEEVPSPLPHGESNVKYFCGTPFEYRQQSLDKYFIKNIFLINQED